ncbi:MAG TPA: hypothetical protein VFO76_04580 [Candidatus Kapabacteria bacterium]|nr:hypothetical protein [Candidatus Kapabacteria bacterium]
MKIVSRKFLLGCILLLSGFLCSCEGSFGPIPTNPLQPPPGSVLSKNGWFHHSDNLDIVGVILPATVPTVTISKKAKVVIGWEVVSQARPALLFSNITDSIEIDPTATDGVFVLHLVDSLPFDAMVNDMNGISKLAIGHVFLVDDSRICDLQIVPYDSLTTFNIIGAVDKATIVYRQGVPTLHGVPLTEPVCQLGYNVILGVYNDPIDPNKLTGYTSFTSGYIGLNTDNSCSAIISRNGSWLQE